MELVNFENLMVEKLDECEEWLGGKDKAIAELAEKEQAYIEAQNAVAEYTEEHIVAVTNYKAELEARLGIVNETTEVQEIDIVEQVESVEAQQIIV